MIKYTPQYLKKLEDLLKENNYDVRYEKGNFRSGYCIVEDKNVVVVNKFATVESRIQALFEIAQILLSQGRLLNDTQKIILKGSKNATVVEASYIAADLQEETAAEPSI